MLHFVVAVRTLLAVSNVNNLRTLRLASGLSIDEAGRRAKIERSRLSRAERDYLTLRPEEHARLAATYDVDINTMSAPQST